MLEKSKYVRLYNKTRSLRVVCWNFAFNKIRLVNSVTKLVIACESESIHCFFTSRNCWIPQQTTFYTNKVGMGTCFLYIQSQKCVYRHTPERECFAIQSNMWWDVTCAIVYLIWRLLLLAFWKRLKPNSLCKWKTNATQFNLKGHFFLIGYYYCYFMIVSGVKMWCMIWTNC